MILNRRPNDLYMLATLFFSSGATSNGAYIEKRRGYSQFAIYRRKLRGRRPTVKHAAIRQSLYRGARDEFIFFPCLRLPPVFI